MLGPFASSVSPLELDTYLAESGGVIDATSGGGSSSLSFTAGLLVFAKPLVLLPVFPP